MKTDDCRKTSIKIKFSAKQHGSPTDRLCGKVRLADRHIAVAGYLLTTFQIRDFIKRLGRCETVHIAVVHAGGRRDQHGVMDFEVGGIFGSGRRYVFPGDVLASLLHLGRDDQQ
jgi:hypothetical protein